MELERHLILRAVVKLLTPLMVVLALHLMLGRDSVGGAYPATILFCAAVIGYGLVCGMVASERLLPSFVLAGMMIGGIALYFGVGVIGLVYGDAFLDYDGIAALLQVQPQTGQKLGIAAIGWAIFLTVSASLLRIFRLFSPPSEAVTDSSPEGATQSLDWQMSTADDPVRGVVSRDY